MGTDYGKIQQAETKLQMAIKQANNTANMSPFEQEESTKKILQAQMDYNNIRAELGHITKQHADTMNADISYQLKLFENNRLRQSKAPNSIVMAHLYEAQMEYLEKIKQMRAPQTDNSSSNSFNNNNSNNNLDDWKIALIQQSMGGNNDERRFP